MPIDRSRYSPDWPETALRIKTAAAWVCTRCRRPCKIPGYSWDETFKIAILFGWGPELHKPGRFVLTVAHLDQNPRNDDPSNLAALCTVCHFNHDRAYLMHNRRRKREREGQLNLLESSASGSELCRNSAYQPPL